jgi:polyhydroxybutyrate depolymerase
MTSLRTSAILLLPLLLLYGCAGGKQTIDIEGQSRSYLLTVPATYSPDAPTPLLLALHQFSDTASGMRKLTGFDAIAEREGLIVCYPQGQWRVWNAGQRDSDADLKFLSALVDKLATEYRIDRDRVYATGISAGGMMAQYLACKTDLLAAVATVAGSPVKRVLDDCEPDAPIPVLCIHGEQDNIVPYTGGDVSTGGGDMSFLSAADTAARWAAINACVDGPPPAEVLPPLQPNDSSRVTRYTYSCPDTAPVIFLSVGAAGHTWPGRDNWYPAFIVGPTSMQLDATETIWNFLRTARRNNIHQP